MNEVASAVAVARESRQNFVGSDMSVASHRGFHVALCCGFHSDVGELLQCVSVVGENDVGFVCHGLSHGFEDQRGAGDLAQFCHHVVLVGCEGEGKDEGGGLTCRQCAVIGDVCCRELLGNTECVAFGEAEVLAICAANDVSTAQSSTFAQEEDAVGVREVL